MEKDLINFVDTSLPDSYYLVALETVLNDGLCHGCWFLGCNDFHEEFGERQWRLNVDPSRAHRFESVKQYKDYIEEAIDSIQRNGEVVLAYMPVQLNITMKNKIQRVRMDGGTQEDR